MRVSRSICMGSHAILKGSFSMWIGTWSLSGWKISYPRGVTKHFPFQNRQGYQVAGWHHPPRSHFLLTRTACFQFGTVQVMSDHCRKKTTPLSTTHIWRQVTFLIVRKKRVFLNWKKSFDNSAFVDRSTFWSEEDSG